MILTSRSVDVDMTKNRVSWHLYLPDSSDLFLNLFVIRTTAFLNFKCVFTTFKLNANVAALDKY